MKAQVDYKDSSISYPKALYSLRGLPLYYHGLTYKNSTLTEAKAKILSDKIDKAPVTGTILVTGCAAPVANQLMATRKVVGIDFIEYYESRFKDDVDSTLPMAPVVILYGVGSEPARNAEYASRLLGAILGTYRSEETLLVIESTLTPTNFATKYGISIKNSTTINLIEEDSWL